MLLKKLFTTGTIILSLMLQLAPGNSHAGVIHGRVGAVGVVMDDSNNPKLAEYDADGVWVSDIAWDDNISYIMSGDEYRAHEKIYNDIISDSNNNLVQGAQLITAESYNRRNFMTVGVSPQSVYKPPLSPYTHQVLVVAEKNLLSPKSTLILKEFPVVISPGSSLGNDVTSVVIDKNGEILRQSVYQISLKVDYYANRDELDAAGASRNEFKGIMSQPLIGIPLSANYSDKDLTSSTNEDGVLGTPDDGFYEAYYFTFPTCPTIIASALIGISVQTPIYVVARIPFKNFNPKQQDGSGLSYYPLTSFGQYRSICDSVSSTPGAGVSLTGTMVDMTVANIFNSIATPAYQPADIILSTIKFNGLGYVQNGGQPVELSDVTEYTASEGDPGDQAPNQYLFDFDANFARDNFVLSPDQINIYLSRNLINANGQLNQPDLTRLTDKSVAASLAPQGLLRSISQADLEDTDVYIYRSTTGQLIGQIEGLAEHVGDKDEENNNLSFTGYDGSWSYRGVHTAEANATFGFTTLMVGAFPWENHRFIEMATQGVERDQVRRRTDNAWLEPGQDAGGGATDFADESAQSLLPGEGIQVIAINRKTGYMGTLKTAVTYAEGAAVVDNKGGQERIVLSPPNLKIRATRQFTVSEGLTRGEQHVNVISNEGAALASDQAIAIQTIWLDEYGHPLPDELPGFTGRIAYSTSSGLQTDGSETFEIKPGVQTQVVQLPNDASDIKHFHVHVVGESKDKNPNFESSGAGEGKLTTRPAYYVPVRVPILDEPNTRLAEMALEQARDAGVGNLPDRVEPIYHWAYRPTMQHSVFDLQVDTINRITESETENVLDLSNPVIGTDEIVDVLYTLTAPNESELDRFSGDRELILSIGGHEVEISSTDIQTVFNDVEFMHYLDTEDFITLRLYQNDSSANVLWEFAFEVPIVEKPNKNEVTFKSVKVDLPNNWSCGNPADLHLKLNKNATVTLELGSERVLDNQYFTKGSHLVRMPERGPGLYEYTITAVGEKDGKVETVNAYYNVKYNIVNTLAIGHAMEENVDLYDGHLAFSVNEINIKDRGPALNFSRSYSSNNTNRGTLGIGWSHNYDAHVINAGCGTYVVSAGGSGGKFFKENGGYRPERGIHSRLEKNGDAFDFYSKDGTHYHFTSYPFSGGNLGGTGIGQIGYKWYLQSITDPDGNTTTINYADSYEDALVTNITDSSGRGINFTYEDITPRVAGQDLESQKIISRITAPDTQIDFTYNAEGQLTRADNNGAAESYGYESVTQLETEEDDIRTAILLSREDPNGNETRYEYNIANIAFISQGTSTDVKSAMYDLIDHPESSNTTITYSSRGDRSLEELTATVNNPRGLSGTYTLNNYGVPLSIVRSNGTVSMQWDMDNLVMTQRSDERGVITNYQHDEFGNITSEKVGDTPAITRTYTTKGNIVNLLASQTDRNNNTTNYTYDDEGHLTRIDYPDSTNESFTYFANGDRRTSTDRNGVITTYGYDDYGNVDTVSAPDQGTTSFIWDARSLRTQKTDAESNTTQYDYNPQGLLISENLPIGNRSYTYDLNGNKLSETDQLNRITRWTYDGENRVTQITRPIGSKTFTYDGAGDLVSETDWNNNSTSYGYNTVHHRTSETHPLGLTADIINDEIGNVLRINWPNGRFIEYTYDDLSRRTSTTDPSGAINLTLDGNGNKISERDQLNRETTFVYDSMNRLTETHEPLGRDTLRDYDNNGNLTQLTDPNSNVTTNTYDDANRLLSTSKDGDTTSYTYDLVGNMLSQTDAESRITNYTYDDMNRRESLALLSYTENYEYDLVGNLIEKATPANTTNYTYDDLNRVLTETDNIGLVASYTYDNNGNKLSQTDANGNTTSFVYNALNFVTNENRPESRNITYTPDVFGNVTAKLDANSVNYTYGYDDNNRLTSETHPNGNISYTYDAVGNRKTVNDKRNITTSYNYDDLNRLTETIDPIGTITRTYDDNGNLLTETDKRNIITAYTYDAFDRVLTTRRANLLIETNTYDGVGNRLSVRDANNNITSFVYNHLDLVTEEQAPLSATTLYTYNSAGQRMSSTDPESRLTEYAPDARGRNLTETFQGLITQYTYDGNGNILSKIRPGANSWSYAYDDADRLTTVTSPTGSTHYTYDNNDNRLSQRDAGNHTTSFVYDDNNLLTQMTYPDSTAVGYGYDANGNRTSADYPNGSSWTATYDDINRESSRSYNDGQSQSNTYDNNNNLTGVTFNNGDSSAAASYVYDNFDRQTQATDRFSQVINYQYDNNGNRTQVSSTGGITNYTYDALNRVTQVTGTDGITTYTYDRSGLVTNVTYPSGINAVTTYDAQARVDTIANQQNSTVLSQYDYDYDDNGNRIAQMEINGGLAENTAYTYDNEDRLTEVDYTDKTVTYTYDANFNRLTEVEVSKPGGVTTKNISMSYNDRNQLTNITDNLDANNNVTYTFDDNGNQTQKVKGTETTTFTYNARDELRQVTVGGSTVGQFLYDHQGLRIEKTGERGIERYTYDGQSVLLQTDNTNSLLAHFQYGPYRLLNLTQSSQPTEYYLFDALGSPVNLTTQAGTVTARYQYDAWGNKRAETGTSFNRFGFTGHEEDKETGLIYAKARFYDPDTGRFLNQDAFEGYTDTPPSLHKYLYAYANPTLYIDPDGREAMPFFSQPIDNTTVQLPTIGMIDTGNQFVDDVLAGAASIPNLVTSLANAIPAGLNAPLKTASVVTGKSQDQIANTMLATAASTGPAAPFVLAGEAPMLPAMMLNRLNRFLKGSKVDIENINKINKTNKQNNSGTSVYNDVPDAVPVTSNKTVTENPNGVSPNTNSVEVELRYKTNPKHDANELRRQAIEDQAQGLESMNAGEIKKGIEEFQEKGRPPLAGQTTKKVRNENPDEATSDKAVTHAPDCCLGNPGDKVTGFGGKAENASIGSQNRRNQENVLDAVKDADPEASVKVKVIIDDKEVY